MQDCTAPLNGRPPREVAVAAHRGTMTLSWAGEAARLPRIETRRRRGPGEESAARMQSALNPSQVERRAFPQSGVAVIFFAHRRCTFASGGLATASRIIIRLAIRAEIVRRRSKHNLIWLTYTPDFYFKFP